MSEEMTGTKRGAWLGHLFALFSVTIWGTSFIVSKNVMAYISPVQLMLLRFILAYITLWVLHPKWHFKWRDEAWFLLLALLANTLYFLAENTALTLTQASNVSILVSTAPILSALLIRLFRQNERLSRYQTLGYAIAFIGVVFVVLNGVFVLQLRPAGDLLALSAALLWAIYGILARRALEKFNSFLITRKLMFYGILTSIPLLAENKPLELAPLITPGNVVSLLYLGIVCSAMCYLMWNRAIRQIGTLKTNIYMYAVPMVTMLAGTVFLYEAVTGMGAIGIVLVIGGMVLSNLCARVHQR